MHPSKHIIINLIISLILLLFINPLYTAIFFLSSFLIDIDHYIYYIFEKKRFSLKSAYNWYIIRKKQFHDLSLKERKKHRYFIFFFHSLELLALLFILSIYIPVLFFIALGFSVHLIEDIIVEYKNKSINRKLFLTYAIYLHMKNKVDS